MLAIVITLLVSIVGLITFNWYIHVDLTKRFISCYGWGNYRTFKREFNKTEWRDKGTEYHLLNDNGGSVDTTYKFEEKGMIINNPISYILCQIYVKKQYRKLVGSRKGNTVKW